MLYKFSPHPQKIMDFEGGGGILWTLNLCLTISTSLFHCGWWNCWTMTCSYKTKLVIHLSSVLGNVWTFTCHTKAVWKLQMHTFSNHSTILINIEVECRSNTLERPYCKKKIQLAKCSRLFVQNCPHVVPTFQIE